MYQTLWSSPPLKRDLKHLFWLQIQKDNTLFQNKKLVIRHNLTWFHLHAQTKLNPVHRHLIHNSIALLQNRLDFVWSLLGNPEQIAP